MSAEEARRQLEIISILDIIYGEGLATTIPCPPELFAVVIRINHLRSVIDGTDAPVESFIPSVRDLLNQIIAFSPDIWAAKVTTSQQGSVSARIKDLDMASDGVPSPDTAVYSQSQEFLNWRRIAAAFKSAVGLYCICSLLGPNADAVSSSNFKDVHPQELKEHFQGTLYQNLREITVVPETKDVRMRKLVLWPLVIAGTQLGEEHEQMKDTIKKELKWLSLALGTSSPLVGINVLERIWCGSLGVTRDGQRPSWDAMFDRPYSFVI